MKNIKYLSVTVFCFFIQCSRNCDIKDFQVKYIGYSNFTISHKEIFPNEKLVIIINDKFIYKYGPKKISYWNINHYKLPEIAKKIVLKSFYQNKIILNKTFFDITNTSKEIIISVPYPKSFKNKKYTFPPKFGNISIEESERDINLIYY